MKFYIDTKTAALNIPVNDMILPILTFCPLTMYGSTPQYIKDKTIALEDRAERIIGGNYRIRSSENKKCERVCSFVHQCLYGNTCDRVSTRLEKLEKLENSILSHPTDWKNWKKKNGPMVQIFFYKLEIN